ncbi:hypothetical protein LWI28_003590 [Acer negundo]|uniref:3-dehydroquinate synthase N-terminal domain-containing protein n=1 Tax=Acer negundo TaxID=4023 RepID=A0AAD5NE96_ACENE|nr:hypothetical protein LWI28_003590 [Acer negundo]
MCSVSNSSSSNVSIPYEKSKRVWIWTESKLVMCAAVERGWNTFIFSPHNHELANDWSSMALIDPLFIKEGEVFDRVERRVATIFEFRSGFGSFDSSGLAVRFGRFSFSSGPVFSDSVSVSVPVPVSVSFVPTVQYSSVSVSDALLRKTYPVKEYGRAACSFNFSCFPKLERLSLGFNNLSGIIPSHTATLSKLKYLCLSWNNLTGAIPLEIGSLKNLVSLYLSGNNLIGPIPSTLGRLIKLRDLDLRKNSLVGPIPSTLGHLIQLKTLYLLVGLCGQVIAGFLLALHIQNLNPIQPMIGKINLKM